MHTKSIICCRFNPFNVFAGTFWLYAGLAFVGVIIIGLIRQSLDNANDIIKRFYRKPWFDHSPIMLKYLMTIFIQVTPVLILSHLYSGL
jgi:hypothetical protein